MEQFDFSEMENSKNRNVGENVPIFRSHAENWGMLMYRGSYSLNIYKFKTTFFHK